jgi:hypothetical protein
VIADAFKLAVDEPVGPVARAEVASNKLRTSIVLREGQFLDRLDNKVLYVGAADLFSALQPSAIARIPNSVEPCFAAVCAG